MQEAVVAHEIVVLYIIIVSPSTLALYVYAEHVFYGISVPVEEKSGHRYSATHFSADPMFVEFLKTDSSGAVDYVDKPNVFFEYIG